jgi:hypothetical protein
VIGRLWTTYKLSSAVQIVKRALRFMPMVPFDVEEIAPRLVARSYASRPNLFDGSSTYRPHPISTAAVSLAGGLSYDDYEFPQTAKKHIFLSLGNVLLDASNNASRYKLKTIDIQLIQAAESAYLEHEEKTRDATSAVVGTLGL